MPRRPKASPRLESVVSDLRKKIISGRFKAGSKLPDRLTLIRQYDASKDTLQAAVNRLIQDGFLTASRKKGTFVTQFPPHRHRVGLVFPWRNNGHWSRYWCLLEELAVKMKSHAGLPLSIHYLANGYTNQPDYQEIERLVRERSIGGLIFASAPYIVYQSPIITHPGIPRVSLMPELRKPHIQHCLWFDFHSFIVQSLDHLQSLGYKRHALLLSSLPGAEAAYLSSFRKETLKRKLNIPSILIQAIDPSNPSWATSLIPLWLSLPPHLRPDSLIVTDETFSEAVAEGLKASNEPSARSLPVICHCNFPAHTTKSPFLRLGYDMGQLLTLALENIESLHRKISVPPLTLLKPHFITSS